MVRVTEDANMSKKRILEESWSEIRTIRTFLKRTSDWKEVDGKTSRRMERENKKMKSELIEMKKRAFGKAGKSTITSLEEALFSVNMKKKMELEELKQNLDKFEIHKGRKVPKRWKPKMKNEKVEEVC